MSGAEKRLALRTGGPANRLYTLYPKRLDDGAGHARLLNHEEREGVQRNQSLNHEGQPSTSLRVTLHEGKQLRAPALNLRLLRTLPPPCARVCPTRKIRR